MDSLGRMGRTMAVMRANLRAATTSSRVSCSTKPWSSSLKESKAVVMTPRATARANSSQKARAPAVTVTRAATSVVMPRLPVAADT